MYYNGKDTNKFGTKPSGGLFAVLLTEIKDIEFFPTFFKKQAVGKGRVFGR